MGLIAFIRAEQTKKPDSKMQRKSDTPGDACKERYFRLLVQHFLMRGRSVYS